LSKRDAAPSIITIPIGINTMPTMKKITTIMKGVKIGFQEGKDCCQYAWPNLYIHTFKYNILRERC